jgi:hypothetical protein
MLGELPRELAEDRFWTKVPPPLLSMGVLGSALGISTLLGVAGSNGTVAGDAFVHSVPWTVWRAIAGAALVVFVLLTAQAIRILQYPERWGFYPPPSRRPRYLGCAITAAVGVAAYRLIFAGAGPDLPVQALKWRTAFVLVAALLAAIPWLTIVWLAHAECRDLDQITPQPATSPGNEYADAMEDDARSPELFGLAVRQLEGLWQLLLVCAGAFTLGVVAAVASSGALRGAFVSAHPKRADEFPPSNVLLYGGMFAVGLAVIAAPLAVAWRNRAQQLVEHACPLPLNGRPTEQWAAERHRIEHLLHLDIPFVGNPLTMVGVLAPLAVSALAAFLPEVAN